VAHVLGHGMESDFKRRRTEYDCARLLTEISPKRADGNPNNACLRWFSEMVAAIDLRSIRF